MPRGCTAIFLLAGLAGFGTSALGAESAPNPTPRRFFADDSFWNQPIPANAEVDPRSERWIRLLETEPTTQGWLVNLETWTIPIYEVDESTPRFKIGLHYLTSQEKIIWHTQREHFGHGPGFDLVPIPPDAAGDPKGDAHLALVDWKNNRVWDMWAFGRKPDGTFKSATGMTYAADGPGVFRTEDLGVVNGESVHFHGPSRASGVPAVAGLILYDEVASGEIRHKIAAASRFCAYQEFVFPAAWTDGLVEGGIPQGSVIQLDPQLDLRQYELTPEERVVCRALQRYGMVLVDIAQGQPIYAEGLWPHAGRSWEGKIRKIGGLTQIPHAKYRVLKSPYPVTRKGDSRSRYHDVWDDPQTK